MNYGKDFARIYNDKWAFWGPEMWAFLSPIIRKSIPGPGTWLDLCCGTGSLLRLVVENGFAATGVDISRHQLRHARKNVPRARFLTGDIRQLALGRQFDVITCLFDSLNYLRRKNDLSKVFRKARRHLAPGGIFAFDMNTYEGLHDHWQKTHAIHDDDFTLLVETAFNARRAMGRCLITGFIREGKRYRKFQEEHLERGYHAREIEDLLCAAGFKFIKFDGNTLGRPRKRSGRLLYICRQETKAKSAR